MDDDFALLIRCSTRLRCLKRFAALGLRICLAALFRRRHLGRNFCVAIATFRLALASRITVLRRCIGHLWLAIRLRVRSSPTVRIGLVASTVPRALVCLVGVRLLLRLRLRRVIAAALFRRIDVRLLARFLPRRVDCRARGTTFVLRICLSSAIGPSSRRCPALARLAEVASPFCCAFVSRLSRPALIGPIDARGDRTPLTLALLDLTAFARLRHDRLWADHATRRHLLHPLTGRPLEAVSSTLRLTT